MWPPNFFMNFGNSSYSVTYRNICRDFVTNLSSNRDAQHYEFRTIKIITYQYLVPLVPTYIQIYFIGGFQNLALFSPFFCKKILSAKVPIDN